MRRPWRWSFHLFDECRPWIKGPIVVPPAPDIFLEGSLPGPVTLEGCLPPGPLLLQGSLPALVTLTASLPPLIAVAGSLNPDPIFCQGSIPGPV